MKDQLISFETAKLAKEKGFDGYCYDCFNSHGNLNSNGWCEYIQDNDTIIPFKNSALNDNDFLRPTQSLLQKWLREVHNIDVYCIPWVYENKRVYDFFINYEGESRAYSSYEKALEIGLQEALKLIK